MQCGKTAGRLSTVTMDYELKRYLSKFTALAAELRKKMRTAAKSCNKKNQVAIEKAKKQKKKGQVSFKT